MFTLIACIRDDHDFRLVILAAIVCALACVTAMRLHRRSSAETGARRDVVAALTGLVAGTGVWATHFIAMLAYQTSLPIRYDPAITAASLVVGIVGMAGGFAVAARRGGASWQIAGGALIGLSIVGLHFTGIAAIRSAFAIQWHWGFVAASVIFSIAGATAALLASRRETGLRGWIIPPVLLVLGIVLLHFTAMAAITLIPDLTLPEVREVMSRGGLALMTGGAALFIIAAAALLIFMEAQGRKAGLRHLEAAFQGVPAGLAMFDAEGRLVLWNAAYERLVAHFAVIPLVGASRYDLIMQSATAGRTPIPVEGDPRDWARTMDADRRSGLAREWALSTGGWIKTELSHLPGGGTVSVITDVSEAKAFNIAMAEARDRAEAANRAKSEFLANMSHEIRTPLNGILGMAQVIEADELTPAQRGRLKVVKESGAALLEILNDLLDLSKVQAGKLQLDIGEVDVVQLTAAVGAAFDGAASARDLALRVEAGPDVEGLWRLDGVRLRQILSNLVGNALKFTHEGEVRLAVRRTADGLAFEVSDTGIGIAPEHAPRLFEKFAQGDATTTRRYGGTGLGLAICRELAELMGAEIAVRSALGAGSAFTVTLPTAYAGEAPEIPAEAAPASQQPREQLRILAAEDNPTNQLVLRSLLQPLECELVVVENGREAVRAAAAGDFDLILMDIQMPEMNGMDAVRAIREAQTRAGGARTPILALSANVMSHQIEEYMACGMDGWVAKPIELPKLYAAMDQAISAAEARAAA